MLSSHAKKATTQLQQYLKRNCRHEVLSVLQTAPAMNKVSEASPVHVLQNNVYATILIAPPVQEYCRIDTNVKPSTGGDVGVTYRNNRLLS